MIADFEMPRQAHFFLGRYSYRRSILLFVLLSGVSLSCYPENLGLDDKKNLLLFGMRAMGVGVTLGEIKNIPQTKELKKVIQAGINLNGHLCANIVSIAKLRVTGAYEVSCIAYQGGSATKVYVVDTNKGIAFEP